MKIVTGITRILVLFALLSMERHCAIKKMRGRKRGRKLTGVNLVRKSLSERHMPSRYLKLKKFMQEYSKKAGVQLNLNPEKRKLGMSNDLYYLVVGEGSGVRGLDWV